MLDHDEPPIVKTEVLEQPKEENESSEDLLNSDNSIAYNPALQGVGVQWMEFLFTRHDRLLFIIWPWILIF